MSTAPELYRRCYAKLLRLYPKPYRERFAEGMQQTFMDLLQERRRDGKSLLGYTAWIFVETLAGIVRENFMPTLIDTPLPNRTHRGKVRDTYDLGDGRLLIVATDRISAFDVVLPNGIPDKGNVLTQMAAWWFEMTREVVPNHFLRLADGTADDNLPFKLPDELKGRSTVAKKAQALPLSLIHI